MIAIIIKMIPTTWTCWSAACAHARLAAAGRPWGRWQGDRLGAWGSIFITWGSIFIDWGAVLLHGEHFYCLGEHFYSLGEHFHWVISIRLRLMIVCPCQFIVVGWGFQFWGWLQSLYWYSPIVYVCPFNWMVCPEIGSSVRIMILSLLIFVVITITMTKKSLSMMPMAKVCLTKQTSVPPGAAQQAHCLTSSPNQRDLDCGEKMINNLRWQDGWSWWRMISGTL